MSTKNGTLILLAAVLAALAAGYSIYAAVDGRIRQTGAYTLAMDRVSSDAVIGAALGRPITRGLWVRSETAEYLTLRIPLSGTATSGHLEIVSDDAGMDIEVLALVVGDERTDLLAQDAAVLLSDSAREAWSLGAEHLSAGQPREAVARLSDAIDLMPEMANAWHLRGQARMALRELEAAEADLIEARRLDPTNPQTPAVLGELYSQQRRYTECVAAYTQVLSVDAEQGVAWYQRARCYERAGERRKARAGAREACSHDIADACAMEARLKR